MQWKCDLLFVLPSPQRDLQPLSRSHHTLSPAESARKHANTRTHTQLAWPNNSCQILYYSKTTVIQCLRRKLYVFFTSSFQAQSYLQEQIRVLNSALFVYFLQKYWHPLGEPPKKMLLDCIKYRIIINQFHANKNYSSFLKLKTILIWIFVFIDLSSLKKYVLKLLTPLKNNSDKW